MTTGRSIPERSISYTPHFRRDYKKIMKNAHTHKTLDAELSAVLNSLIHDIPLERGYHDHALNGPWKDFRDCHLDADMVLIYHKPATGALELVRLGSHDDLGI